MSPDKPTKSEDEYFAKEDAEKVKRLKEKLRSEILEEQRKNIKEVCHMKCPKCGGNLKEVVFRGVRIDKCNSCNGVWLDNGELGKLAGPGEKSSLRDIISLFKA
jgi:hypothetical protein